MTTIQAIKNGDQTAFEDVYKQFQVKLFRFLLKKTGSNDIAQEATQLTFIRLWQFRHTLSEEFSIDTQLFRIARTSLFNYLRDYDKLHQHLVNIPSQEIIADLHVTSPGIQLEHTDQLKVAIASLPPVRQKVFVLSRLEGLSNKEIAGSLSISIKTVEEHISKANKQLRSILALSALLFFHQY